KESKESSVKPKVTGPRKFTRTRGYFVQYDDDNWEFEEEERDSQNDQGFFTGDHSDQLYYSDNESVVDQYCALPVSAVTSECDESDSEPTANDQGFTAVTV